MRAAIYARYSTDLQSASSIEDQVRLCTARSAAEGWTVVGTYTDHALSGANHLRPGYQQLLADARAGAFDVVIAEALDRLDVTIHQIRDYAFDSPDDSLLPGA